jgi:hypothetical protein
MRKLPLLLCLPFLLLACVRGQTMAASALSPDFEADFERLFLSGEPLRYQDNVAFLDAILEAELTPEDRDRVRAELKQFLAAEPEPRPYAPDSLHTGVAPEIAFLRLQAMQVLAQVGTREDAAFLRDLRATGEEHPLFEEARQEAIETLESITP